MAIVDEIERIKTNIENAYTALEEKGATLPTERNSDNLSAVIVEVPTGGGEVEKGIIINAWDNSGYITDITVVGLTSLPNYYLASKDSTSCNVLNKYLQNVNLPSNLTQIGNYAFQCCPQLALTSLPSGITSIGKNAFYGCQKLALTSLPQGITTVDNYTFYSCQSLTNFVLPSGVTSIGQYAFQYCLNLTEITCLGNITKINNNAFASCSKLAKFVLPNITAVPTLANSDVFFSSAIAKKTGYIYVPDTLVTEMQSASNWTQHAAQIKGLSELPTE